MNRRQATAALLATACTVFHGLPALAAQTAAKWPIPPRQPRIPRTVGNFGHKRVDDYAWLRPADWQAVLRDPSKLDAPIAAAIKAEAEYADVMLAPAAPLAATLRARADQLHRLNETIFEVEDGGYIYFSRKAAIEGQTTYLRRLVGGGAEQILFDGGVEAKDKAFFTVHWNGVLHSADGKLVGWAQDLKGSGIFQIRVRDIATGKLVVDDLDNGHGGFAFDPGGRYLYWVGRNDSGTANAVWRRDMQTGADVKLHAEDDTAFFIDLRALKSGKFVMFRMMNGAQSEAWLIPAGDPAAKPILVAKREPDLRYEVEHWNDRLIILTDADGAVDQKLMTARVETPGRQHWQPLVTHQPGRFIAAIHVFRDHLVREEWRDALPRLVVTEKNGREHDVAFDDPAFAIEMARNQGWDVKAPAFTYQSPRKPKRTMRLDLAAGKAVGAPPAPTPGFDPDRYVVERIVATATDGARIPITLLSAKGVARDGKAPLFLYGYGSYGATVDTVFRPAALAMVDQGWVWAIAHVRGGAERGNDWWRSVLRKGKRKTFTDFIACAEHLVAQRYTAKGRIVAHGYSAGGLLMGAAYTMRPDLWAGVIAQVPFVDPLNSMDQYETHPLGTTALPIWGDPRIPDEYAYIASYSPYDNLKATDYPALLATGNVADERVAFFEPLKFAVKARQLTTAGNPILVKISPIGGHVFPDGSEAARAQDATFGAFAAMAVDRKWGDVPQR